MSGAIGKMPTHSAWSGAGVRLGYGDPDGPCSPRRGYKETDGTRRPDDRDIDVGVLSASRSTTHEPTTLTHQFAPQPRISNSRHGWNGWPRIRHEIPHAQTINDFGGLWCGRPLLQPDWRLTVPSLSTQRDAISVKAVAANRLDAGQWATLSPARELNRAQAGMPTSGQRLPMLEKGAWNVVTSRIAKLAQGNRKT
ncbi:hypothetical protein LIA77_10212 [Sarocladium implicatum]|nr:hypothetical protein LIA77_10212 [Sarocladium implicatum]